MICLCSIGVKRRTICSVTKKFRHNFGTLKGQKQIIEILNQNKIENTDCGRPVGSAISTIACLCVKRLKIMHQCLFQCYFKNPLKPFFLCKNLFFQHKNLLEKPFFRVSVAGKPEQPKIAVFQDLSLYGLEHLNGRSQRLGYRLKCKVLVRRCAF